MKKLFLILAAAVVLPSLAFAQAYGEKSRPDSAGDIVFADGTATAWREGFTLTEEQKKAAVAVIFYAGTECSNDSEYRVLGVGLAQNQSGLAWCESGANAYEVNITTIQCKASGSAGAFTFTGDLDGSDNLSQIGVCLAAHGWVDDTADAEKYPAFHYAKNYAGQADSRVAGTPFAEGWYLPTVAELFQIWKNREGVDAASALCGGDVFGDGVYWSSSQYAPYVEDAYGLDFGYGVWYAAYKGLTPEYDDYLAVCAVRDFTERTDFSGGTPANVAPNKTMTVRENLKLRSGEDTSTQVLAVMSAGAKVRILELGKAETIDGIPSNWVKVEIISGNDRNGNKLKSGMTGWCYGGYLR